MTSSMTSLCGLELGPLYSFINEIATFFMITKNRAKISSLNFLCISIMRLWLHLYKYIFMTSLMTSPYHKVGQILKFEISPSIFELEPRLKAQNVGNAHGYLFYIFNFRYNFRWKSLSRAQNGGHFENSDILNTASIWPQIWKNCPKLCQKSFFSWWWHHRWHHSMASKFPSIFMFRRGWPQEHVASTMSRQ